MREARCASFGLQFLVCLAAALHAGAGQDPPAGTESAVDWAPQGRQRYQANLWSISRHPVPDWFHDAKLGIFPVWGIYSVPGWATPTGELGKVNPAEWFFKNPYAEWYWNTMKLKESETWSRHVKRYGADFEYADFIPMFREEARKWDPRAWASLFKEAGGQYVVFTAKFADGYPLWPTAVKHPKLPVNHIADGRDYVGELTTAVRDTGLRMGLYYCGGMDWSFIETPVKTFMDVFLTIPQSEEYARVADAHWRELIDRYQPAILWNDIAYPRVSDFEGIVSDYYNRHPDGLVNDRWGRTSDVADFKTPEYAIFNEITPKKWESTRGLGYSFGYNQAEGPEHLLSADQLVDLLADIVSKNGNLLLAVGPRADGSIPELQAERLRELGKWLAVNGEAIYGTRFWAAAEGVADDGLRVRFTGKPDGVYAILLDKPARSEVVLRDIWFADGATVKLLGGGNLRWRQDGRDVRVMLPDRLPDSYAHAMKITPKPWKLVDAPTVSTRTE